MKIFEVMPNNQNANANIAPNQNGTQGTVKTIPLTPAQAAEQQNQANAQPQQNQAGNNAPSNGTNPNPTANTNGMITLPDPKNPNGPGIQYKLADVIKSLGK